MISQIPVAIVVPPLLAALLAVALATGNAERTRLLVLAGALISASSASVALWQTVDGHALHYTFGGWAAPFGIVYHIDGLSALMATLIGWVGVAVLVYAGPTLHAELPGEESSFLATLSLLLAALQGMVVTGDLFNLYVFLEIASITTYTLIAVGGGAAALASFRYLLIGTVGATFYLLGLAYLFALTGTLNMADMAARLPQVGSSPSIVIAVAFIVTGLSLKMALFPMHTWLPDAYTYAPSSASALIAAVMTKVNAFALLRVLYGVLWPAVAPLHLPITSLLGWAACGGIVAGSVMALAQTDLKRLLAYSSVGHLAYIALGIALGNRDGLIGAVLHMVAHAVTKGCLFLIIGGVAFRFGGRSEDSLERIATKMPRSMAALVISSMSMIGIPPTLGFFSKWYLLLGCLHAGRPIFAAVLLLSTLLNAWYFFRLIETIYFSRHASDEVEAAPPATPELPRAMMAPIAALACAVLLAGVLTAPLVRRVLDGAIAGLPGRGAVLGVTAAVAPEDLRGRR